MNPSKQQLAKSRVLVVGDAMLDRYWHGAVERISPEAPVPVVQVSREEERIGAAANVAYNVATLGAQASFLGVVGDDEPGHRLESLLRETGIAAYLKRDAMPIANRAGGIVVGKFGTDTVSYEELFA
jgi:rfaE bifunctional protein kinase chain/domain